MCFHALVLLLLCLGILGYLYCLVHLIHGQRHRPLNSSRICAVGLLAFVGGGLLRQTVVGALLETVPLAINVWIAIEVMWLQNHEPSQAAKPHA